MYICAEIWFACVTMWYKSVTVYLEGVRKTKTKQNLWSSSFYCKRKTLSREIREGDIYNNNVAIVACNAGK